MAYASKLSGFKYVELTAVLLNFHFGPKGNKPYFRFALNNVLISDKSHRRKACDNSPAGASNKNCADFRRNYQQKVSCNYRYICYALLVSRVYLFLIKIRENSNYKPKLYLRVFCF